MLGFTNRFLANWTSSEVVVMESQPPYSNNLDNTNGCAKLAALETNPETNTLLNASEGEDDIETCSVVDRKHDAWVREDSS